MTDPPLELTRGARTPRRFRERAGSPYHGAGLAVAVCAALVHGLASGAADEDVVAVSLAVFLGGSALAVAGLQRGYEHAEFGAANTVTLIRLALVSVLAGVLAGTAAPGGAWAVPAIAALALALDGIDGWLARRTRLASGYGARFDMEVDCALALVLALLAFDSGKVGAWVLGLGLARYGFWVASWALPWLAGPLPERRSRKVVCVVQIGVLVALMVPPVGPSFAGTLAGIALLLVAWSFALDIRHLFRARP